MKSTKGPMGFNESAVKTYAHFDHRVTYAQVKELVENPEYVAHHGYLPLISKTIVRAKYDGSTVTEKERNVSYASHLDRCIYQRYSYLLNQLYNDYSVKHHINHVAIAYRTNLHKSNVDFAYTAFSKIADLGECHVFVTDFEGFFDSLDHSILKKRLRLLFDGPIPDDYYSVYKSAIRYSVWDLDDLMARQGLDSSKRKDVATFNRKSVAISRAEFKKLVKDKVTFPWKDKGCGIPQGLPISGVLANIFMLEFDTQMCCCAEESGGLYMRYSDDIILIAPSKTAFESCLSRFNSLCDEHRLSVEASKTNLYVISNGEVRLRDGASEAPSKLQYLGFDFDGSSVRIRQRTIGGYYAKMHRMAKWAFYNLQHPSSKRVEKYYLRFSSKGMHIGHGNFLTYSKRAEKRFRKSGIKNDIGKDTDKHYLKMRRMPKRIAKARQDDLTASKQLAVKHLKRK